MSSAATNPERLARLFAGRTDCYGAIHGECVKVPLLRQHWIDHVERDGSIGVYPLVSVTHPFSATTPEWFVKWGCIDLDNGYEESLVWAKNLHLALKTLGLTSWIERTKSKGCHVWILVSDWVPAIQMRAVQLLACALVGYHPKEINPKQVALGEGQLGNYVNIPYAKKWAERLVRVVLDGNGQGMPLEMFLNYAEHALNSPTIIAEVAAIFRPPSVRSVQWGGAPSPTTEALAPLLRSIITGGPLFNEAKGRHDRSAWLAKIAYQAQADGLAPEQALALVNDADLRVEKYVGRHDRDDLLRKIVEKAYGG